MRNLDLNSLTSLYENKVVLKNVLNEELPYWEGPGGIKAAGSASTSPDVHRAAMSNQPSYAGEHRLNEEQMKKVILIIGQEILDFLKTLPGEKFVGGETSKEEDDAFRAKIAEMIFNKIKMKSGEPIYQKAFAKHIARQLVDALLDVNTLSYSKPAKGGKGGGGAGQGPVDAPDL